MLEKPAIPDESIIACLQAEYALDITRVEFLPLGADLNTAVYRLTAQDGTPWFFKLRSAYFDETSVLLPRLMADQGISQVIPPLPTRSGQLWGRLQAGVKTYTTILYPFIAGDNANAVPLSPQQWTEFGAALRRIHTLALPPHVQARIRREDFSPQWRKMVQDFLAQAADHLWDNPLEQDLASFLSAHQGDILGLLQQAEDFAAALRAQPPAFTLCHSDVHAYNLLLTPGGPLYIVDWDDPILAPKERDLMFIGGGQGFSGCTLEQEEDWFYRGYDGLGQAPVDRAALAYYRFERILVDIAVICEQIFLSDDNRMDREQEVIWLKSNFDPGSTIEMAYRTLGKV
jgi:spectinomycin phosphotransferase